MGVLRIMSFCKPLIQFIFFFVLAGPLFLFSREIRVSSLADSGPNTLRQALTLAEPDDLIVFNSNLSGTILLESSLPSISGDLAIFGPSSQKITIDGNQMFSIFTITGGDIEIRNLKTRDADPATAGSALFVGTGSSVSLSNHTFTHLSTNPIGGAVLVQQNANLRTNNVEFVRSPFQVGEGLDILFEDESGTILTSNFPQEREIFIDGGGIIFKRGRGPISLRLPVLPLIALDVVVDEGELTMNGTIGRPVIINPEGSLKGLSIFSTIINAGRFKPGLSIGTVLINSDYIQNPTGTLEVDISPNNSDKLLVSGNADIDGSLLLLFGQGMYFKGTTYTFLETEGRINGIFPEITVPTGLLLSVKYGLNAATIVLGQNSIGFPVNFIGGNAGRVRSLLEIADIDPVSELGDIATALNALKPGKLQEALDQLHPGLFGAWSWNNATLGSRVANTVLRTQLNERTTKCCIDPCCQKCCGKIWINAIGIDLDQSKVDQLRAFDTLAAGFVLGWDTYVKDNLLLGIVGGYVSSDLGWNTNRGSMDQNSFYFGGYGTANLCDFYLDALIMGSYFDAETKRNIAFGDINKNAKSCQNDWGITGHIDLSYFFCCNNNAKFYPFFSFETFSFFYGSFTEEGADSLNLEVQSHCDWLYRLEGGIGLSKETCTCYGAFIPRINLSAFYFSHPSSSKIKSMLASVPEFFTVRTGEHNFFGGLVSLDLGFMVGNCFFASAGYTAEIASKRIQQELNMFMQWRY